VDLERFAGKSANQQISKEPAAPLVIGTAARLSAEKGLTYLIDALVTLREQYGERVRLRVAGEGPERAKLEAQVATLGLSGAVELVGWLEHDKLPAFLQEIDVFALPSTWEGFGVAAAEASACGLPVVATDVYGIPDVVRPNVTGLLVPPKDPAALAKALGRLIDNPALRSQFGRAGREYVASHYDWRDNAKQMESIYASLVTKAPVGAAS
jgi:glycosyltransferase involved in cell wall biosynthesis